MNYSILEEISKCVQILKCFKSKYLSFFSAHRFFSARTDERYLPYIQHIHHPISHHSNLLHSIAQGQHHDEKIRTSRVRKTIKNSPSEGPEGHSTRLVAPLYNGGLAL